MTLGSFLLTHDDLFSPSGTLCTIPDHRGRTERPLGRPAELPSSG